jgi:hypothetical protein
MHLVLFQRRTKDQKLQYSVSTVENLVIRGLLIVIVGNLILETTVSDMDPKNVVIC